MTRVRKPVTTNSRIDDLERRVRMLERVTRRAQLFGGAPTGVPVDGELAVDYTNHKLYFGSGGVWRGPLG